MEIISNEAIQEMQPGSRVDRFLTVRQWEVGDDARWDEFVRRQPAGTFFHLSGWKRVIEKTFGFAPCYLYAERDGEIAGVAPLFQVSNWLIGRCLISTPLAVYGGICAQDETAKEALLSHLKRLAARQQVEHLELRNRNGGLLPDFQPNPRYAAFTAKLLPDPEAMFKRLPKDTRYMVRKAQKAGLSVRRDLRQMDEFYRLYAISMRRLGTPVFPRALLQNLMEEFPGQVDLLMVYSGSKPLSGVFSFFFRDTVLPYYAGAAPDAPRMAAANFMYWELMKQSALAGLRCFDFGRSKKGTGAYAFKSQWNMTVESLDYQVYLVRRKSAPNFSPTNPKFDLAIRLWRRMPLPLTTWLGPRVIRWFP